MTYAGAKDYVWRLCDVQADAIYVNAMSRCDAKIVSVHNSLWSSQPMVTYAYGGAIWTDHLLKFLQHYRRK